MSNLILPKVTKNSYDFPLNQRQTFLFKPMLWYYRILGITFGGLTINENGIEYNQSLKIWGYISAIVITCICYYSLIMVVQSNELLAVKKEGLFVFYYVLIVCFIMLGIQMFLNYWFILCNGSVVSCDLYKVRIKGF